jgi:LysM repeat protein
LGKFHFLGFLLASIFWANTLVAQQFNEKQVQLIDGKTYYLHKVEKGNTLYSLSKMYSIKVKDLLAENPQLEEGLKIDQVIRIPVKKVDKKITGGNAPVIQEGHLIHEVLPKETLYALSKRYGVSVADLQELNPELKDGLKIGMELKIPPPKELERGMAESVLKPAVEDSFMMHFVEPQQTLYSLALEYDVNMDSIRLINGGLPDGLKVGTTIRIPITKQKERSLALSDFHSDSSTNLIIDSNVLKEQYIISLLIPFYLDSYDTLISKQLNYQKEQIYKPTQIGLEFYTGFKYGLEHLDLGTKQVEIRVHDISLDLHSRSTEDVDKLLATEEFFETDLIIGPFHRTNVAKVAEYAKKSHKPLVCPVPQRNDILQDNPYMIKVYSSDLAQVDFMQEYAANNWKGSNVVLIENNELKDVVLTERFQGINGADTNWKHYNEVNSWLNKVKIYEFDTARINRVLNDSVENIILMPMNSRSFIGRFLAGMNKYALDYNIKIVGLDSWNKMGYIEYRYLNNLNVHTVRNQFCDFQDTTKQNFVLEFRNTYQTEPNDWTLLGYDIANYFVSALANKGTAFQNFFSELKQSGISKEFNFKRVSSTSGFENQGLKMVKIENYQYIELPKHAE